MGVCRRSRVRIPLLPSIINDRLNFSTVTTLKINIFVSLWNVVNGQAWSGKHLKISTPSIFLCCKLPHVKLYVVAYTIVSGGFRGGASAARARPPAQSHAHFVGLFKSFKTTPTCTLCYRLLKFSTQKPPEIPIFGFDILKFSGGAPPLLGPLDPPLIVHRENTCTHHGRMILSCPRNPNCRNILKN